MARKILIALTVLGVVLVAAAVVVGLQPDHFAVERSTTIAAPPAEAFARVNDLKAWDAWSPWKDLDPNARITISTPSSGRGATFAWAGNDAIGEGRLTILESRPDERVEIEQAFVRPLEGKARMTFTFTFVGDGTGVTWRMDGTNNFVAKAVCMFMDMDAVLGKEFERGLASLKAAVETGGPAQAAAAP